MPPGAARPPDVPPDETLDAISGHFRHLPAPQGPSLLDRRRADGVVRDELGAVGARRAGPRLGDRVGRDDRRLALPGARFVTIEAQDESVRLARKSAAYNGSSRRYEIRHGDFRDPARSAPDERFDLVLGSPPYFPLGTGIEGDHPQKVACRFELRGDIADYARVAAAHLEPGGLFACVFPEEQRARVEARCARRRLWRSCGGGRWSFREGEPPLDRRCSR